MELLFATLIGMAIGFGVSYFSPGRDTYGSFLVPAVSAAVTAVVWVGLLWLGWTFDGTWIWVVSLFAGGIAALAVVLSVPRRRRAADAELQGRLSKA
jgi:peptidoglycan biosynthesis protein MviN/MurJ (putative lipid II flippase)